MVKERNLSVLQHTNGNSPVLTSMTSWNPQSSCSHRSPHRLLPVAERILSPLWEARGLTRRLLMPLIISADGGSDPPGGSDDPLDDDPEQRFGDPVRYFSELEDIEEDIALYRSNSITGDYELNVSFPSAAVLSSIVVQSDTGFVEMQTVITQRMLKPSSTSSAAET